MQVFECFEELRLADHPVGVGVHLSKLIPNGLDVQGPVWFQDLLALKLEADKLRPADLTVAILVWNKKANLSLVGRLGTVESFGLANLPSRVQN